MTSLESLERTIYYCTAIISKVKPFDLVFSLHITDFNYRGLKPICWQWFLLNFYRQYFKRTNISILNLKIV